ncbi:hypothetical protein VZT92_019646 [Zoarces viviparus]|uniref:Uncharacterized protein n=1 Tax=Zoarces viviparus TaxID=48416 RepID=A0AAW1ELQ8_ZOAVI
MQGSIESLERSVNTQTSWIPTPLQRAQRSHLQNEKVFENANPDVTCESPCHPPPPASPPTSALPLHRLQQLIPFLVFLIFILKE